MSIDIQIILVGLLGLLTMLMVHVRYMKRLHSLSMKKVLRGLTLSWAIGVGVGLSILSKILTEEIPFGQKIEISFLTILLSSVLFAAYFLGIFILTDSSIRIKILLKIAEFKAGGVAPLKLREALSPEVILRSRLNRLIESGDILFYPKKRVYTLSSMTSPVVIREILTDVTMRLLGV